MLKEHDVVAIKVDDLRQLPETAQLGVAPPGCREQDVGVEEYTIHASNPGRSAVRDVPGVDAELANLLDRAGIILRVNRV